MQDDRALRGDGVSELHPDDAVIRSIGAFRERPVELDAACAWRGRSTNPALHRLLRDVLPRRDWTTGGRGRTCGSRQRLEIVFVVPPDRDVPRSTSRA
jgi:hypothetical protein